MARCPFAEWRPLPGQDQEPPIPGTQFIFHTMVGGLPGTDHYFRTGTSLESHFGVGGPWEGQGYDGALWQWVDTARQADATGAANARAISVETSDGGDSKRPWTPRQLDTLIRLGRWARTEHGIPARIAPRWDAPGFGWHALFPEWNPNRHSCPDTTRIAQLHQVVFPAIFAAAYNPGADMPLDTDDKQWIEQRLDVHEENVKARINLAVQRVGGRTNSVYHNNHPDFQGLVMAKDLAAQLAELLARPAPTAPPPPVDPAVLAAAVVTELLAGGVVLPAEVDPATIEAAVERVLRRLTFAAVPEPAGA